MSSIIYNSIEMDYVRITIQQEMRYDDPSHLQYRDTKFTINVTAHVTAAANPAIGGDTQASQVIKRVRSCLSSPQKPLQVFVGNDLYLQSPAPTSVTGADAANGPFPRHVDVSEIVGTGYFLVNFTVETYLYECCTGEQGQPGTPPAQAWSTHTWSEDISIDRKFLTTRVRNGVLTVRGDTGLSPDSFRSLVIPPIPNGFMRESSKYLITEDQLALRYSYTDKEVYKEPPNGCIDWEGQRMAESDQNGVKWQQQVRVKVYGAKTTSKAVLLNAAMIVVINAININGALNPTGQGRNARIIGAHVEDSLTDNWIEITLRCNMLLPGQTFYNTNNAGLFLVDLDHYAFENPLQTPPDPGTLATALLQAVAPILNDPCLNRSVLTTDLVQASLAGSYGPPASVATLRAVPNTLTSINTTDQSLGIIEHYELRTSYTTDYHTMQLPKVGTTLSSFGTMAPASMTKTVAWTATRWDQTPTMPDPLTIDPNNVLLHTVFEPEAPQLAPDGQTPIYRVSGVYIYGVQDPTQVVLSAGSLAHLAGSFANALYTTFSSGIIDPGLQLSTLVTGGFLGYPPVYNPFTGATTASLTTQPPGS